MNDDELMELFSAFDDVSASESLQASTLDFIMGAAAAASGAAAAASEAAVPNSAQGSTGGLGSKPEVTATRGGKPRIHRPWSAMRTAAVAACLTVALTGGVAYAFPASTVLVTQGETAIELQVNVFGQVVSASANDAAAQSLINGLGLMHTQYSDSVSRVSDSLKESNPKVPVAVVVNGVEQMSSHEGEEMPQGDQVAAEPDPLANGEPAVQVVAAAVVENEPEFVSEADASDFIGYESPVYLPEPVAVVASEDESSQPAESTQVPEETTQPSQPSQPTQDPAVPAPGDDTDTAEEVAPDPTPAQPVVIDEEPNAVQDEQPVDDSGAESGAGTGAEAKTVYDNLRPPDRREVAE